MMNINITRCNVVHGLCSVVNKVIDLKTIQTTQYSENRGLKLLT